MAAHSPPRFSVIIPAFNYGKYLARAIDSVLKQAGNHAVEVIVVDDGSTDDTPAVLAQYQEKISTYRQDNQGVSVARNLGVSVSRGEWLVFLDADDRLLPDALNRFEASVQADSRAQIHFGHYYSISTEGTRHEASRRPKMHSPLRNFRRFLRRDFTICTGTACYHRTIFQSISFPIGMTNGQDVVVDALALARHPAKSIPYPIAEIFDHPGRSRNNVERMIRCGTSTVDAVFNSELLPEEAERMKAIFLARWNLTLARTCYRAGDYERATHFYRQAFAERWVSLCHLTHGVRFLKSAIRTFWNSRSVAQHLGGSRNRTVAGQLRVARP